MSEKTVFGILASEADAQASIVELAAVGVVMRTVSVAFLAATPRERFGLLDGLDALVVGGVGALVAGGPLSLALRRASDGSLTDALVSFGVPENQARRYEGKVRGGATLLAVHTARGAQIGAAKNIFTAHGAGDVAIASESSLFAIDAAPTPPSGSDGSRGP